jgi:hypothetical protein
MILCSIALLIIPACNGSGDNITATRPAGTILGQVVDTVTDTPLRDVTVTIISQPLPTDVTGTGTIVITTMTDVSGSFNRSDIPNGQVIVRVSRSGYRTPPSQIWALTPGGNGEFYFEMAPGVDPPAPPDPDDQYARPPDSQWDEL